MAKPLLSICIPTYNRAEYLKKCLDTIIQQDGFSEIEIIISDNCSSDNTEEISKEYQKKHENILYFKNQENVSDRNYPLVFQRANGSLRKLTNDTVIYRPGAIRYMLNVVKDNINNKAQIYFRTKGEITEDHVIVNSLDDYIQTIGHNLTWIRSIAIWEDDCSELDIMVTEAESRLAQVPFLLTNFEKYKKAIIYDKIIMDSLSVEKKDLRYGLYNVFYENFLGFIKRYVEEDKVSIETYEWLRKDLLLNFFYGWVVIKENNSNQYIFSDEDLQNLIKQAYKNEPYFREYIRKTRMLRIKKGIKRIVGKS